LLAGLERVRENISRLTAMDLLKAAAAGTNEINVARRGHLQRLAAA
jgi:hypothetical protein